MGSRPLHGLFLLFLTCFMVLALHSLVSPTLLPADDNPPLNELMEGFKSEEAESKSKDDLESIMDGFKEDDQDTVKIDTEEAKHSMFDLDGYLKHGLSYNFSHDTPASSETDWRGPSRFRSEVRMELKAKLSETWQAQIEGKAYYDSVFVIRGRDEFTGDVLENREQDAEFGESYILGSITDSLDVRFGRQIVVWGKSDNIRITDVLNPLDLREPGLVDIEDLRLPVVMTRLDYYWGQWNLSGLFLHEIRLNKAPAFGSDFFGGTAPLPPEDIPADSMENTEFAAAISGILRGWDAAFYFADFYNDQPHQETSTAGDKELKHARLKMTGAAFNIALGNWLLKTEAAYLDGFHFFNAPGKSLSRFDVLGGFEYTGFHETSISFEIANRHLFDFDDALKQAPDKAVEDEFQSAFRITRDFLNDTLTVTFLAQTFGIFGDDGALQRISADYDLTDAVQLSGGFVFYTSGDLKQFNNVGDNDRFFFAIKYSF